MGAEIINKNVVDKELFVTEANSVLDEIDFVFENIIKLYI